MELSLSDQLQQIASGATGLVPEAILCVGMIVLILFQLVRIKNEKIYAITTLAFVVASGCWVLGNWHYEPTVLFHFMLRADDFSCAYKLLFIAGTVLTVFMSLSVKNLARPAEYFLLLIAITLGANLLVMSTHFIMVLLSLELMSISGYVLAGFHFSKNGSEASLKYFLFGSAATAVMIYGISLLYGLTGTLYFMPGEFVSKVISIHSPLLPVAVFFILSGFLFKASAVPFHLWAPDVYEAAPMPVVAFLSVVPKLAGIAALLKFTLAIHAFGQSSFDWQSVIAGVAILSITMGNLAALGQREAKRMMAYSSIAQAGFMIAAIAPLTISSTHFLLFYSTVFLLANFLVFIILHQFEIVYKINTISAFSGLGKKQVFLSVLLLTALIALTGLPPTAGFSAKLFIFSSLWEGYSQTGKNGLLWLLVVGLLNTVISLFFYLKIPLSLFIKDNPSLKAAPTKFFTLTNLLCFVLVVGLLVLFFYPGLLMGWLNRINFVL